MNEIPDLVLEGYIFSLIPVDQLNELRMVCKKWYFIIESMVFNTLVISRENELPVNQRWFQTDQPVDCKHTIIGFEDVGLILKKKLFRKFQKVYFFNTYLLDTYYHLKILSIFERNERLLTDISSLNFLDNLKELNLGGVHLWKDCELVLPNLKFFKFHTILNRTLTLKAVRLERMSAYNPWNHLEIVYPDSIIHFEKHFYDGRANAFSNVETLSFEFFDVSCLKTKSDYTKGLKQFEKLKKLKELHIHHLDPSQWPSYSMDFSRHFDFLIDLKIINLIFRFISWD